MLEQGRERRAGLVDDGVFLLGPKGGTGEGYFVVVEFVLSVPPDLPRVGDAAVELQFAAWVGPPCFVNSQLKSAEEGAQTVELPAAALAA